MHQSALKKCVLDGAVAEMPNESIEEYWQSGYDTLYDAYFYELGSERLIRYWNRLDLLAGILTALTASSSAVSGWALWAQPKGKMAWAVLAGTASALAIVHAKLAVPGRIREEERHRQRFAALRIDLETFMHDLRRGLPSAQAKKAYDALRKRLSESVSSTPPDALFGRATRKSVQAEVNERLKGYTSE